MSRYSWSGRLLPDARQSCHTHNEAIDLTGTRPHVALRPKVLISDLLGVNVVSWLRLLLIVITVCRNLTILFQSARLCVQPRANKQYMMVDLMMERDGFFILFEKEEEYQAYFGDRRPRDEGIVAEQWLTPDSWRQTKRSAKLVVQPRRHGRY